MGHPALAAEHCDLSAAGAEPGSRGAGRCERLLTSIDLPRPGAYYRTAWRNLGSFAIALDTFGELTMGVRQGFIDNDGRLLRGLEESERLALGAAGRYVAKHFTCFIAKNHGKPRLLGSGTLIRVEQRVYVATAKHLFEGLGPSDLIAVYWNEKDHRAGVGRSEIVEAQGDLDLAALPLDIQDPDVGLSLDALGTARTSGHNELFVISGIPTQSFACDEASRTVVAGHWSLGLVALPQQSWPAPGALNLDRHILFNYTKAFALDGNGKPMQAIDPPGLSGGGVWEVPISDEGIWLPEQARLVAVQSSVETKKWRFLCATRIRHWVEMVRRL